MHVVASLLDVEREAAANAVAGVSAAVAAAVAFVVVVAGGPLFDAHPPSASSRHQPNK